MLSYQEKLEKVKKAMDALDLPIGTEDRAKEQEIAEILEILIRLSLPGYKINLDYS